MKHPLKLQAFTMIEMLVVIAIIGILVGITFPVVMRAKMKGQIVKSATNLKNIGAACRLYTSDNEGFFPSSPTAVPTSARDDYNLLIPSYASKGIFQAPTDATALQIAKTNTLTTLVANENSYTYFSGLRVYDLTSSMTSTINDSSIPIATERLNDIPKINTNPQTLTNIFNGTGVNVLKSDGAVTFVPATGTGVRLYNDTNMVSVITNASWKKNEL